LLKSRRQQLHQQITHVLVDQFPETVETQPELLAHHYTEAGLLTQAIPYWQKAGQRASEHSANAEAVSHLTKGLELLKMLADTSDRVQQELTLQLALGSALMVTKGWANAEVERTYTRACELCRQVGETPQLFSALYGLQESYVVRAEFQIAQELEAQCLILAQRIQDPALLLESYHLLGGTSLDIGELPTAHMRLEQAIALYDPQQHGSHTFLYAHDPGVCCLSQDAFVLWSLGYPDQALKKMHQALRLAQELFHPVNRALALFYAAWFHQYRQEVQVVQERAEACITLCTEQGLPFTLMATILRGWALAEQGEGEGIGQIRRGLAFLRAAGSELWRSYFLALLAEAYGKTGQREEELSVLAEALAFVDKTGERFYEAELYRLKGTLTLQSQASHGQVSSKSRTSPEQVSQDSRTSQGESEPPSPQPLTPSTQAEAEAEACFLKAIEIARQQQAKSLELRAATSLARLWQQQGKQAEAHNLLLHVYAWFTEGFDTKDLQEAKALLDELAEAR
jgi:predicted ATPase